MQKEKAKTFVIFLLCVVFLSHSVEKKELVSDLKDEISFLENRLLVIDSLTTRNTILKKSLLASEGKIKKYEDSRYKVTVTMYHPVAAQTDDTPNITADGTLTICCPVQFKEGFIFDGDICDIDGGATFKDFTATEGYYLEALASTCANPIARTRAVSYYTDILIFI